MFVMRQMRRRVRGADSQLREAAGELPLGKKEDGDGGGQEQKAERE